MSPAMQVLVVGCGGFIGAVARFVLTGVTRSLFRQFPTFGTLVVNVIGCFVIGMLMGWVVDISGENVTSDDHRTPLPEFWRLVLITGLLGSLTTFSTFAWETLEYAREDNWPAASWNFALNVVVGFAAVWLGRILIRGWGS